MKRTTRNPVKSKQEIIEKSAPIFNQFGYAGTRMDMIVKATGYQKGGIYRHFNSKMDLAIAAFRFNYHILRETYFGGLDEINDPKEKLLLFLERYEAFIKNPPLIGGCPILNSAIETDDTDEEFRLLVKEAFDDWNRTLQEILVQGIQKGQFKSDIDPRQEANFIISTVEGSIMLGKLKRSIKLMLSVSEKLKQYFEKMIYA